MGVGAKIEQMFPSVKWNGSSDIHRSICRDKAIPEDKGEFVKVMTLLVHGQFAEQLWGALQENFSSLDWMLSADEFRALVLVDIYSHLTGQGDSKSEKKIKNPKTGNVFHRLAIKDDIVTGIRFWVGGWGNNMTIGFRFRLAENDDSQDGTKKKARAKIDSALVSLVPIMDSLKIADPSNVEQEVAHKKVRVEL